MSTTLVPAQRAWRPPSAGMDDHLRMLTATNVAARIGDLDGKGGFPRALPFSADRGPSEPTAAATMLHAYIRDDFFPHGDLHVGAITLAATLAAADARVVRELVLEAER